MLNKIVPAHLVIILSQMFIISLERRLGFAWWEMLLPMVVALLSVWTLFRAVNRV